MNDHEQEVLDGIEAATLASSLDQPTSALVHALAAFNLLEADRLHTTDIIEVMEVEETWRHWADIPLPAAAKELAELLEDHDVRPRAVTVAGRRARGYNKHDLETAWLAAGQALQDLNDDINQGD
jgi:hypothetical protein